MSIPIQGTSTTPQGLDAKVITLSNDSDAFQILREFVESIDVINIGHPRPGFKNLSDNPTIDAIVVCNNGNEGNKFTFVIHYDYLQTNTISFDGIPICLINKSSGEKTELKMKDDKMGNLSRAHFTNLMQGEYKLEVSIP